jgi:hypothetical protein
MAVSCGDSGTGRCLRKFRAILEMPKAQAGSFPRARALKPRAATRVRSQTASSLRGYGTMGRRTDELDAAVRHAAPR